MDLQQIHISNLKQGDNIINLGTVIEIEQRKDVYAIVILRMDQKQVIHFLGDEMLFIKKEHIFQGT